MTTSEAVGYILMSITEPSGPWPGMDQRHSVMHDGADVHLPALSCTIMHGYSSRLV